MCNACVDEIKELIGVIAVKGAGEGWRHLGLGRHDGFGDVGDGPCSDGVNV